MTREELWLAAIAGLDGVNPPDSPVWHYEQMLAAIYDAVTGAADPRPFPERSWHLDEFLYAVYCAVAGLGDPGCPAPTCRIEEFWKGIYDAATGDDSASVPDPVWRIEEFLAGIFDVASGWGASVLTETGNAPLTLANAIARAIKSLTQTGLCTQSGTPTPSAPVDIKCNNGALKLVDDELPSGYKRVLGIDFDGSAYYMTGEKLYGSDVVTMTLANTTTTGQNVFGAYSGTASGNKNFSLYVYGGNSTSSSYLRYNETLYRPRYGSGERTISFGAGGTDGFATDVSFDEATFESSATAYIGALPNSSSPKFTGTIVGNIAVGTRLMYVPCERVLDNAVGYYEVNSGVFLAPQAGTPTFSGYDTSHLTVLSVVGTPEVLTVTDEDSNTQTASVVDLFAVGDYADTQEIIGGAVMRKVGIKVFDGTEEWAAHTVAGTYRYRIDDKKVEKSPFASTHFVYSSKASGDISNGEMMCGAASANAYFRNTDCATLSNFTAWLAEQYAAGTPVIVIYPLATETAESVAGQSLSTVAGTNVVSVTAEVSPVALTCEYYGASS